MADPTPDPAPVPDHLADLRAKAEQLAACGDVMSRELLAAWAAAAALTAERDQLLAELAFLKAACKTAAEAPGGDWLDAQLTLCNALLVLPARFPEAP